MTLGRAVLLLLVVGVCLGVREYRLMWHRVGNWSAIQGVADMLTWHVSNHECQPPRDWAELAEGHREAGGPCGWTLSELEQRVGIDFAAMWRFVEKRGDANPDFLRSLDPPGSESALAEVNARLRDLLRNCRGRTL